MAYFICAASFLAAFLLNTRSLAWGINTVLTVGYLYGITRANYPQTASHFIFDAAVIGFFLRVIINPNNGLDWRSVQPVKEWVMWLIGWSVIMFLVPFQHPLIQLVGLRANTFFVPFILIGAAIIFSEYMKVVYWLAVLNLMAFGLALAEFWYGIEPFYPESTVTEIIYKSKDLAGGTAYRIPACFSHAHPYASMMNATLPFLAGAIILQGQTLRQRLLLGSGIVAAIMGVFFTATRSSFIVLAALLLVTVFSKQWKNGWIGWVLLLGGIGYIVSKEERLQRFTTLQDTDAVISRIEGSLNLNFIEILLKYPLGNGMGAGGTSIPYFLQGLIRDPVGMENEYSRILLETGIIGLLLWITFFIWVLQRNPIPTTHPFYFTWRLMWYWCFVSVATAWLGTGLMIAIPSSVIFFLTLGIVVNPPRNVTTRAALVEVQNYESIARDRSPVT